MQLDGVHRPLRNYHSTLAQPAINLTRHSLSLYVENGWVLPCAWGKLTHHHSLDELYICVCVWHVNQLFVLAERWTCAFHHPPPTFALLRNCNSERERKSVPGIGRAPHCPFLFLLVAWGKQMCNGNERRRRRRSGCRFLHPVLLTTINPNSWYTIHSVLLCLILEQEGVRV